MKINGVEIQVGMKCIQTRTFRGFFEESEFTIIDVDSLVDFIRMRNDKNGTETIVLKKIFENHFELILPEEQEDITCHDDDCDDWASFDDSNSISDFSNEEMLDELKKRLFVPKNSLSKYSNIELLRELSNSNRENKVLYTYGNDTQRVYTIVINE